MTGNFAVVPTGVGVPTQPELVAPLFALNVHVESAALVPNCPLEFAPQQYAVPSAVRPHAGEKMLLPDAALTEAKTIPPVTAVGVIDGGEVTLPAPSDP